MALTVTIHRGQNEIGGNCVEIASDQTRILLDVGQPLSGEQVTLSDHLKIVDAVIISHPHQDHYGLMEQLPDSTPLYMGITAEKLIRASCLFMNRNFPTRSFGHIEDKKVLRIGDLSITPYLVDHSAFDAYAFLVEGNGESVFYTGDLRMHGRKPAFVNRLLRHPPALVDTLLTEGTMLGRGSQKYSDERTVENAMVELMNSTDAAAFFIASSQNLDRLVSAFRACIRTGRIFVVDIYTAWILRQFSSAPRTKSIPDIKWDNIRVLSKGWTAGRHYERLKANRDYFGSFVHELYADNVVITQQEIAARPSRSLIKTSHAKRLIDQLKLKPCSVIYSMWEGYLEPKHNPTGWKYLCSLKNDPDVRFEVIHTSGHAVIADLKKLVAALNPKKILPIHTEDGDRLLQLLTGEPPKRRGAPVSELKSDNQINQEVDAGRGKSTGWPTCLTYSLEKGTARVVLTGQINKTNLRKIDCWGLAFFDYCKEIAKNKPTELILEIPRKASANVVPNAEALHRRVSYLNLGEDLNIRLLSCGVEVPSYVLADLLKRPASEIVRTDYAERGDDDTPGRLEKDFQAYLFGKGKNDTTRTNERLAILGEDFRDLNKKKYSFVMEREFPTGVFDGQVSAHTRILPTDFIDVVSFNKRRQLSLIELKVNDSSLPVISQAVDYALFFTSYQKQLWDVLKTKLGRRPQKRDFVCYVANNCFHKRFDAVARYYSPINKGVPFKIKKVVLGGTVEV